MSHVFALRDALSALAGNKDAGVAVAVTAIAEAVRNLVAHGNNRPLNAAAEAMAEVKGKGKQKESVRAAFTAAVASIGLVSIVNGAVFDERPVKAQKAAAGDAAGEAAATAFAHAYGVAWTSAESAAADAAAARKAAKAADTAAAAAVPPTAGQVEGMHDDARVAAGNVFSVADAMRAILSASDEGIMTALADVPAFVARIVAVQATAAAAAQAEKDAKLAAQATRRAVKKAQGDAAIESAMAQALEAAGAVAAANEEMETVAA